MTQKQTNKQNIIPFRILDYRRILSSVSNSVDFSLLLILVVIMLYGILMIASASSYVAFRDFGTSKYFYSKQIKWDIFGLAVLVGMTFFPLRLFERVRYWYAIGAFLILTLVYPFGIESHNATRWVQVPGTSLQFQPAEVSKILMILFAASSIDLLGKTLDTKLGAACLAIPTIVVFFGVFKITDNLSSAIIILGIVFVMWFVASRYWLWFIGLIVAGGLAAWGFVAYVASLDIKDIDNFRFARIAAWLHPEASSEQTAHQTLQALYAIGNGGILGKGLGSSVQKISKLPEPHNDMIFAVICEELGIVGAIITILMYVVLLWRLFLIARETRNRFDFMIVVGVMAHIAIQVILNIAVATGSMPNTGVSLPFISYGGSSAVLLLAEMGLVMGVYRRNNQEA